MLLSIFLSTSFKVDSARNTFSLGPNWRASPFVMANFGPLVDSQDQWLSFELLVEDIDQPLNGCNGRRRRLLARVVVVVYFGDHKYKQTTHTPNSPAFFWCEPVKPVVPFQKKRGKKRGGGEKGKRKEIYHLFLLSILLLPIMAHYVITTNCGLDYAMANNSL